MNYIVEDDFDFFKELNKHKSENILAPVEDISRCLISHDPHARCAGSGYDFAAKSEAFSAKSNYDAPSPTL